MEDKKAKQVSMDTEVKQPTVEELKNFCNQLLSQRNELASKLQEITAVLNKLPWLFKVLEYKDFFDAKFIEGCVKEIEILVAPYEEKPEEKGDK